MAKKIVSKKAAKKVVRKAVAKKVAKKAPAKKAVKKIAKKDRAPRGGPGVDGGGSWGPGSGG